MYLLSKSFVKSKLKRENLETLQMSNYLNAILLLCQNLWKMNVGLICIWTSNVCLITGSGLTFRAFGTGGQIGQSLLYILTDQLTLFQSGGQIIPTKLLLTLPSDF